MGQEKLPVDPQDCPFCEEAPTYNHDDGDVKVECQDCLMSGPFCGTMEEAAALWNRIVVAPDSVTTTFESLPEDVKAVLTRCWGTSHLPEAITRLVDAERVISQALHTATKLSVEKERLYRLVALAGSTLVEFMDGQAVFHTSDLRDRGEELITNFREAHADLVRLDKEQPPSDVSMAVELEDLRLIERFCREHLKSKEVLRGREVDVHFALTRLDARREAEAETAKKVAGT